MKFFIFITYKDYFTLLQWISSDYFESLLLPQLLRGENDSKQSDEIQANDWLYINRFYEKQKWNLGRIFFHTKSNELPQSLGCL